MGYGRIEIWNPANTSKLADLWDDDIHGLPRNVDTIEPSGWKLNEAGSGGFTIQEDHPAAPYVVPGNVVRVCSHDRVNNMTTPLFGWRIREIDRGRIKVRQADKTIDVKGKGLLGDWEDALVGPWRYTRPISATRVFNWASPGLDLSGWTTQLYIQHGSPPPSMADMNRIRPEAWPVPAIFGWWCNTRAFANPQPLGDTLFRRQMTFDSATDVVIYLSANNSFDLWINGASVQLDSSVEPDTSSQLKTWRAIIPFDAGTHDVAIKLHNWGVTPATPDGTSALNGAAFKVVDGKLDTVIWTTNPDSGTGWYGYDYPATKPGFTAPEILGILLSEAQSRGELIGWTITTHGVHSEIPEIAFRVGTRMSDVIDTLTSTHIDVSVDPTALTLHIWPTLGTATGVTVTPTDLTDVVDGDFTNAAMGIWAGGVTWRVDQASINAHGRRATSVQLGALTDAAAVDDALDAYLAANSTPITSTVGSVIDTDTVTAGVDYTVGDTITIDDTIQRCTGLTWTITGTGELACVPEWDSVVGIRRRERERAYDRQIAGFDPPGSAPLLLPKPLVAIGFVSSREWTWSWSDDITDALNEIDPDKPWQVKECDAYERIWRLMIEIDPADLGDAWGTTTVTIIKNGTELNPLYRTSLTTSVWLAATPIWGYESIVPGDRIQIACLEDGGHVDGAVTLSRADTP